MRDNLHGATFDYIWTEVPPHTCTYVHVLFRCMYKIDCTCTPVLHVLVGAHVRERMQDTSAK